MYLIFNNSKLVRKLNTKGCCFFCLRDTSSKINEKLRVTKSNSLRNLLRHLQIKPKYGTGISHELSIEEKNGIEVELCHSCQKMNARFSVLFQQMEKVQMEMNYFTEQISSCILDSREDPELIRKYITKMKSDEGNIADLKLAENLRKEVADKGSDNQVGPMPCIKLDRVQVGRNVNAVVKEEIIDEFEDEFEDDEASDMTAEEETEANMSSGIPPIVEKNTAGIVNAQNKFPCEKCGKNFAKQRHVDVHVKRVHLTAKNLNCEICNKKFKHPWNLREHKESVHLGKKFICQFCRQSFSHKPSCKRHEKICMKNPALINLNLQSQSITNG